VTATVAELPQRVSQEKVRVGGAVHTVRLKNNKKGDRYATFNLEDKSGTIEVILWPEAYRKHEALIASDDPLCVAGTLEVSEERCQIIADELTPLAVLRDRTVREIRFRFDEETLTAERATTLMAALETSQGTVQASIEVLSPAYVANVRLPLKVTVSDTLAEAVERAGGQVVFVH
jgi:DNA polymerase-3 subunit alpha